MNTVNPLEHPICLTPSHRQSGLNRQSGYIPLGMYLVDILKPATIVELGTCDGDFYCAFCQTVKTLGLNTRCYSIAVGKDNSSALDFQAEIDDLRKYHDPLYGDFSLLLSDLPDEALTRFREGTVDVLSLVNYPDYESLRHDFELWLPKLSTRGIILFHDICSVPEDRGINRFWTEVKSRYPHFEFLDDSGLGIISTGKTDSDEWAGFLAAGTEEARQIREFFIGLGHLSRQPISMSNAKPLVQDQEIAADSCNAGIQELTLKLDERNSQIEDLKLVKAKRESEVLELNSRIRKQNIRIYKLENQIAQIQHQTLIQMRNKYQKIIEKLFRKGSLRRKYYELGLRGINVIVNQGWRSFFRQAAARFRQRSKTPLEHTLKVPFLVSNKSQLETIIKTLEFPDPGPKPGVSIIIPVYNKWQYTVNCLKSIMDNTQGDYEVIVVNDVSTDETVEVLSRIKNLRLISNEKNSGFIDSCNHGSGVSRGEYLLFLNNDTMVTPNWLPPLTDLGKRPDVGAVGSKLVFGNGTLQEAGGIIWSNALGWNYGRDDDPGKPEYNYVREVDYCSGASLLVKKILFDQIGGFDIRFRPGYYEDTDLCFSIRNLGYKVMYQPQSVVIHFEGISNGTETTSGMKRYQEINHPKFIEKWQTALEDLHFQRDEENIFRARERNDGRIVLFIDHYLPTYDRDAGSLTTFQYIQLFIALDYKVIFWPDNLFRMEPYTSELQQMGVEVIYGQYEFQNWIKENGRFVDVVWLARPHISIKYIDILKEHSTARILYYGHDLHYLREQRRYEVEHDKNSLEESRRWKKIEFRLFNESDVVLTPSSYEEKTIVSELPAKRRKVVTIPPFVYQDFPAVEAIPPFGDRNGLLFLAGFNHTPNIDAVLWFVKECFPYIVSRIPDIKFYIAGSNPTPEIKKLASDHIVVTGFIKDLAPVFARTRLFVSPLRYGAGVKGKIVTSFYYGVPVVTTTIGAEGMNLIDGENALIADDPLDFAENVVKLYNSENLWNKISEQSICYIKDYCSFAAAKNKLDKIIKSID